MNTKNYIEEKIKKIVLKNKKKLLVASIITLGVLLILGIVLHVSSKIEDRSEKNTIDYSKIVDKDGETHKKLLNLFSEENDNLNQKNTTKKDTIDLNDDRYNHQRNITDIAEPKENQNDTTEPKEKQKNDTKQKKGNTVVVNNIKNQKNTQPVETDAKKNNHISSTLSNKKSSNKYSLSFGESDDYVSNTTSRAKLVVMESKKYKNNELIRLRFLDDFENYKKNQNVYGRIIFFNDRAKIFIEEDKNLYLYSKDGLEGIKIGVDIKDLKAKNQVTSNSIDAVGNIISNSVRSVDPTLGLLTQASNTAISTGRIYLQDNEILINIDEGTYLYVKRPKENGKN